MKLNFVLLGVNFADELISHKPLAVGEQGLGVSGRHLVNKRRQLAVRPLQFDRQIGLLGNCPRHPCTTFEPRMDNLTGRINEDSDGFFTALGD
jgi:hypothetical protein